MRTNYHTHYNRCRHAQGTAEDYVLNAIRHGLTELGFSDHAPFPDVDFGMRMPFCELTDYLADVDTLTAKYKADIILRKGLEIEYFPEYRGYYEELFTRYHLEYLLMGEHFFKTRQNELLNIYNARSTSDYIDYALAAAEGMESGFFKVLVHPDLYMINAFAWDDNCTEAANIILDAAAATGTILEFNANGFRRGKQQYPDGTRYPYPHRRFWEMASTRTVKVIVGSDCHDPSQVWNGAMEQAYEDLRALGIRPILRLLDETV